jgi:hypothetical protein
MNRGNPSGVGDRKELVLTRDAGQLLPQSAADLFTHQGSQRAFIEQVHSVAFGGIPPEVS